MTHQYKKIPVKMKRWMQFNVMPWSSLGVERFMRRAGLEEAWEGLRT